MGTTTDIKDGQLVVYKPGTKDIAETYDSDEDEDIGEVANLIKNIDNDIEDVTNIIKFTERQLGHQNKRLIENMEDTNKLYGQLVKAVPRTLMKTSKKVVYEEPEEEPEEAEEEVEIAPYDNEIFNGLYSQVMDDIKKGKVPLQEQHSVLGDRIENFLSDAQSKQFFDLIHKKPQDVVYNTKDVGCKYYTQEILNYDKKSKETIQTLIKNYPHKKEQILKDTLPKLDYMVVDFVSDDAVYELKALAYPFSTYKKRGYINLVSNKITGYEGEFKPYFKNVNGVNKFDQIKYAVKHFGKTIGQHDVLKSKPSGRDYIVIFFLSDGVYYYEPLKDENFTINENGRGSLSYEIITKTPGGFDCSDYKIPINKLKQLSKKEFDKLI